MINILLKINHSASENDNVTARLIISIALLSLWIFAGHPFKKKNDPDESIKRTIYKIEIKISFILLVLLVIISVYRSIRYFFFE
jgi:hypothetical protein